MNSKVIVGHDIHPRIVDVGNLHARAPPESAAGRGTAPHIPRDSPSMSDVRHIQLEMVLKVPGQLKLGTTANG